MQIAVGQKQNLITPFAEWWLLDENCDKWQKGEGSFRKESSIEIHHNQDLIAVLVSKLFWCLDTS